MKKRQPTNLRYVRKAIEAISSFVGHYPDPYNKSARQSSKKSVADKKQLNRIYSYSISDKLTGVRLTSRLPRQLYKIESYTLPGETQNRVLPETNQGNYEDEKPLLGGYTGYTKKLFLRPAQLQRRQDYYDAENFRYNRICTTRKNFLKTRQEGRNYRVNSYFREGSGFYLRYKEYHSRKHKKVQKEKYLRKYLIEILKAQNSFPRKFNKASLRLLQNTFRVFFERFSGGISESTFFKLWDKFRRGANRYWTSSGVLNLVGRFAQALQMSPQNFLVLIGVTTSRVAASVIAKCGGVFINGQTNVQFGTYIQPGDTLQIVPSVLAKFQFHNWHAIQRKIKSSIINLKFFQADISMLLFTMISLPKRHEVLAPSFLSDRWIRFYTYFFKPRRKKRFKWTQKRAYLVHRYFPRWAGVQPQRAKMKPRAPKEGSIETRYSYLYQYN